MPAPGQQDHRAALTVSDPGRRAELAAFVGRAVQLDPAAPVRLRWVDGGVDGSVTAWVPTPFEVLATHSVPGHVRPSDVTVGGTSLLTALAVERTGTVDPGPAQPWRAELPPEQGWAPVGELPGPELAAAAERGLAAAQAEGGRHGPSDALLDAVAATVADPGGPAVRVPLRCLFALSGLGLLGDGVDDVLAVAVTPSWLRLDTPGGGVVRRRHAALPLLV